jgi:hypothetical protein
MKDNLKKHQKLQSPVPRDEKLSKGAESKRERINNRPRTGKPAGMNARQAIMEKLDMHAPVTSAKQPDESSKEDVYTGPERIRYASIREVTPNNSTGEVF